MPLGLSLDEVQQALRSAFLPERTTGSAFIKRPTGLDFLGSDGQPVVVLAFVRQTLEQEKGRWAEKATALRMFAMGAEGEAQELDGNQRAAVVRASQAVSRSKDPSDVAVRSDLIEIELQLLQMLRRPTDEKIEAGVRYAVWPLAALVLLP